MKCSSDDCFGADNGGSTAPQPPQPDRLPPSCRANSITFLIVIAITTAIVIVMSPHHIHNSTFTIVIFKKVVNLKLIFPEQVFEILSFS